MSPVFCHTRSFPDFKTKIIKNYSDSLMFLEFFWNLDLGTEIGFDYETSGMAMESDLKVTGAALATTEYGAFWSFTDIQKSCADQSQWEDFKSRFAAVLTKHQSSLWAYNIQFEQQVSWREFMIDIEINDASVYNVLDGYHSKNYSLKWTAQRLLQVSVWDTDFDMLGELFDSLYYVQVQAPGTKGKKGLVKELKCDRGNWEQ